jgi:hypothetical protein
MVFWQKMVFFRKSHQPFYVYGKKVTFCGENTLDKMTFFKLLFAV